MRSYFYVNESVSFEDILLIPQYSDISTRKDISLASALDNKLHLELPIISAPMDTVTGWHMVDCMSAHGGMGIIHRYNTIEEQVSIVKSCKKSQIIGAAIGVSGDYLERASALVSNGVSVICIDVAHGHHALVRHALTILRNTFGHDLHIMAGNVATLDAFNDLADWGANSIRVGIGGGSICSTRIQTGHGIPTLQSILDCSASDRSAKIIADGGIKNSGDMVKAFAAGADFVMVGSLLAATPETPNPIVYQGQMPYKSYRGMASVEAQISWRGHTSSVEGVSHLIPLKKPAPFILKQLDNGIRSGLSYSGCQNLPELHTKAKFIKQSSAGQFESSTHIKSRF